MLWIHYNFLRDLDTQIKLHKKFRSKIREWYDTQLVERSVLTYHFNSLYLCLDIPSVRLPSSRGNVVQEETLQQIPLNIRNSVKETALLYLTNPLLDKLEVLDYEWELISGNASRTYDYAPIEEILRFSSKGTEIALELLDNLKTRNRTWKMDGEVVDLIKNKIQDNLISERERKWGLHFVCNSAFIIRGIETIIRGIINQQIDGKERGILEFLYEIERTGNYGKACQHFLKEYRQYFS